VATPLTEATPRRPGGCTDVQLPDCFRYGLVTTGALTSMDVSVIVRLPFLASSLIMSSLVSSFAETPGCDQ
jgi:hypothetical protein